MNGRPSRESVLTALFNKLVASVQTSFTADTGAQSQTLANPSTTTGLFLGLPVFGTGIPRGAVITSLSPLTISDAATANALQVSLTTGFLTTGRRLQLWTKVASQPALFLREDDEELEYIQTILQRQTIHVEVWIYSKSGQDPDLAPAIALNNLLDAVQAAFAPDNPQRNLFTLGSLVEWCRIEGKIEKFPGDLDGQAAAIVPVLITVP